MSPIVSLAKAEKKPPTRIQTLQLGSSSAIIVTPGGEVVGCAKGKTAIHHLYPAIHKVHSVVLAVLSE